MKRVNLLPVVLLAALLASAGPSLRAQEAPAAYILGPDDQILIRVVDIEEVPDKPVRIDMNGNIKLPIVGHLHVGGLTVEQFEALLVEKFGAVLQTPTVTVFVAEFRSQPVSVLGAVRTPGVHQIRGSKTLFEVLSLAGGLNPDAGSAIRITRRKSAGPLPLPGASDDSNGEYQVAEVSVKSVMEAQNPKENIQVLPDDVVTVPKADMVYVIGAVHRSGGFILSEKGKTSVLQALSLAEGLDKMATAKDSRIMRLVPESDNRLEIPINLKEVLAGKSGDVALRANDILFVPTSGADSAARRR